MDGEELIFEVKHPLLYDSSDIFYKDVKNERHGQRFRVLGVGGDTY